MKSLGPAEMENTCEGCGKKFMAKKSRSGIGYKSYCDPCIKNKQWTRNFNLKTH